MLPRTPAPLKAPVTIPELPAMRRMPAPTPLPTLRRPGLVERISSWFAPRTQHRVPQRHSAQVVFLRA
jgi:hypothetical protein